MDEEKIQELIEEEVQKRVKEEKEKIREEVKSEIQEEKDKNSEAEGMSRRSFLRKLGAGTLGLGALSFLPASALNVRSDGFSFYGGSGSGLDFDVDNSGNVLDIGDFATGSAINFQDGLTVSGSNVWHAGNDGSGSGLDADTLDGQEASSLKRWEKIGTDSGTDVSSLSVSWTKNYDEIRVNLRNVTTGSSTFAVCRLNGDSSRNYDTTALDDSDTYKYGNRKGYYVAVSSNRIDGYLTLQGQNWDGNHRIRMEVAGEVGRIGIQGSCSSVSSPITQVDILIPSASISGYIMVEGRKF